MGKVIIDKDRVAFVTDAGGSIRAFLATKI